MAAARAFRSGWAMAAKTHEMARRHLQRVLDHFGSGGGFGEIGDPDDQAAALLFGEQGTRGAGVIGFGGFGADLRERLDDGVDMLRASSGG